MAAIFLYLFRFLYLVGSGHQAIALENLALRRQLAAFRRKRKRPVLTEWDHWFWMACLVYGSAEGGSGRGSAGHGPPLATRSLSALLGRIIAIE